MSLRVCINRSYFYGKISVGNEMNLIPLEGNATDGFTITFPLPFLLLGFGTLEELPTGGDPVYDPGRVKVSSAAINSTNKELLETLFIGLMEANRDDTSPNDPALPINYTDGEYLNYFKFYLNNALKPRNYNTFLYPESAIADYWDAENALASQNPAQALFNLMKSLRENTDLRMWGAPGTYTINPELTAYAITFNNWTHNAE